MSYPDLKYQRDSKQELPHHQLIGDPQESFYQLGVKDRAHFLPLFEHLTDLLRSDSRLFNLLSHSALELASHKLWAREFIHKSWLKAYAEGLQRAPTDVLRGFLLPELLSSIHKWIPQNPFNLLGCSSLFALDEKTHETLHARVLDFPLIGTFDSLQRSLVYRFQGGPRIWSYGSPALPFPAITAMNSEGVSIALHQKFSDHFDISGTPIFEIVTTLLWEGHSKKSLLKLLSPMKSMAKWGLYIGCPGGEVLEIDIVGEEKQIRNFQLTPGSLHYFNNIPLSETNTEILSTPQGMHYHNQMRHQMAKRKIERFESQQKPIHSLSLLKILACPLKQAFNPQEWKVDTCTPTSLHIVCMHAIQGEVVTVPGPAPKVLADKALKLSHLWHEKQSDYISTGVQDYQERRHRGYWHWGQSIGAYDRRLYPEAFHHIQMSLQYLENSAEVAVIEFYFLVMQYIHLENKRERQALLHQFQDLKNRLPDYLRDHCLLFIFRLEKWMFTKSQITSKDFQYERQRSLFESESKLNSFFLNKLRKLIFPRPDALDVIYLYQR